MKPRKKFQDGRENTQVIAKLVLKGASAGGVGEADDAGGRDKLQFTMTKSPCQSYLLSLSDVLYVRCRGFLLR